MNLKKLCWKSPFSGQRDEKEDNPTYSESLSRRADHHLITGDSPAKVFLVKRSSNELVIFAKTLAAKMAGTLRTGLRCPPGPSCRLRWATTEGHQPGQQQKDIINLQAGKAKAIWPPPSSEVTPPMSRVLSGSGNGLRRRRMISAAVRYCPGQQEQQNTEPWVHGNSPNRGESEANTPPLRGQHPTRQTRMLARRPLLSELSPLR